MILKSSYNEPAVVRAVPSSKALPENWVEEHREGQLAVDVAEAEKEIIVVSTMAGAETDKIEVYLQNDLLTIRGVRSSPLLGTAAQYLHQECFWGRFSRTVVLPSEVKGELAQAEYKNGVLTIRIPKQKIETKVQVVVVDE